MNTHKLLPCSFCGLIPNVATNPDYTKAVGVECPCGRRSAWHVGVHEAAADWNRNLGSEPDEWVTRLEV